MNRTIGETKTDQNKLMKRLLNIKTLLVICALFDFVFTLIRVSDSQSRAFAEAVATNSNADFMYSPMQIAIRGPGILLLASIGLWLSRPLSYLAAMAASLWLLYSGLDKWNSIATSSYPEIPMWAWSTMTRWWVYHGGEWDFPRLFLGALILISATILSIRLLIHKPSVAPGDL